MSPQTGFWRRIWKPAALTGAGGTAAVVWIEEIMLYAQEILALIFLPILAGVIYLLDIFMFKSRLPKREDLDNSTRQGEQR